MTVYLSVLTAHCLLLTYPNREVTRSALIPHTYPKGAEQGTWKATSDTYPTPRDTSKIAPPAPALPETDGSTFLRVSPLPSVSGWLLVWSSGFGMIGSVDSMGASGRIGIALLRIGN